MIHAINLLILKHAVDISIIQSQVNGYLTHQLCPDIWIYDLLIGNGRHIIIKLMIQNI